MNMSEGTGLIEVRGRTYEWMLDESNTTDLDLRGHDIGSVTRLRMCVGYIRLTIDNTYVVRSVHDSVPGRVNGTITLATLPANTPIEDAKAVLETALRLGMTRESP